MTIVNKDYLKLKIRENGFSYAALAEMIGVDRDTICNVVKGTHRPSYGLTNKILYGLHLTADEFLAIFYASNLLECHP